ncbi:MAG: phage portal protein, partial [Bdellovibrionales bacterium]|nr:phage portal protein [Bdellovibrionales bacterium]
GEVISRDVFLNNSLRLQILEADFICDRDQGIYAGANSFVNGLVMDEYGRPSHFAIYERHPGDKGTIGLQAHLVPASDLIHTYRQDRPGQNRGISWFNSVAHPLKMLNELQWTQLMRLKLSAAITGVVTQEPSQLAPDQLKKQRQQDFELSPGTFTFLNHGETINFPNIPNPEGFGGTCKLTLQEIAAGLGITYEALAGDLSNVNFSSGRLGDLQFRANIEDWRWHMLVPRFLNPAFQRFIRFCELRGVDARQATVEWTPPARQMISPLDEINAAKNAMRSGLQSLPGALRELGLDPERHLTEISDSNALIDKLGLILDSDPRRTSNGQLQSPDSLAGLQELSK